MSVVTGIRDRAANFLFNVAHRWAAPNSLPYPTEFFEAAESYFKAHYESASQSRIYAEWPTTTDTPYNNIKTDLPRMISRSRRGSDNNGLSDNVDRVMQANVVGPAGIRPEPVVKNEKGELDANINNVLRDGWERYNDEYDRTGKSTYYEMQGLGLKTIINSGSVVRNTVRSKRSNLLPIANQFIEPDKLDWTKDRQTQPHTSAKPVKQTQFGINLDKYGAPVSYWVRGIPEPIDAANMDIRFRRRRPEQYIGVPWKAPALKFMWDLDNLLEDRCVASRIQATIAWWMNKKDAGMFLKNKDSSNRVSMEPGRILYSTEEPKVIESKEKVSETFDPLTRLYQRVIGVGVGLSYQILTRDLTGMNFASSRANILEDRRTFQMIQRWFIKEFCQVDWRNFVKWMFLSGKMAPLTFTDFVNDAWRYEQCFWQPPGWDWVDPLKDAKAAIELRKNNMMSLKEYYGSRGKNWAKELEQIALEKKELDRLSQLHGVDMGVSEAGSQQGMQQMDNLLALPPSGDGSDE